MVHFFVISILVASISGLEDVPRVVTENGRVVGTYETSASGKKYKAFRGIPYAQPPVADLRFKEPVLLDGKWVGEWNAQKDNSKCLQLNQLAKKREGDVIEYEVEGSEDCLYLSIFSTVKGPTEKAVLFIIHPGAFMFGSGNQINPMHFMERDDIILVTFNYRLGPLGFLSTGDKTIPGNNGLKDQAFALNWVHRNVQNFGGNPEKITIMGDSAGAASVDFMYMSPHTQGLFQRGIAMSGSSLNPWAIVPETVERSIKLAEVLGCPTSNSRTIRKCLRRRPAEKIVEKVRELLVWMYLPIVIFGPVIENGGANPYLYQHPREHLEYGQIMEAPLLYGCTKFEGLYPTAEFIYDDVLVKQFEERWKTLMPLLLALNSTDPVEKHPELAESVLKQYLGGVGGGIFSSNKEGLIKVLGERLFYAGIVEAAQLRAKADKGSVHLYNYGYSGSFSLTHILSGTPEKRGASHADDFFLLTTQFFVQEEDKKVLQMLRDILVDFVINGDVPPKFKWPPVTKDEVKYLQIDSPTDVKVSSKPLADMKFWQNTLGHEEKQAKDEL